MTTRKPNPTTGRYPLTAKNRKFKAVVAQRRAEVAEAAELQRSANIAALNAVIAKAEAAAARTRAAGQGAQGPNEPTEGTPEGETPADSELGAEDGTEPPPE